MDRLFSVLVASLALTSCAVIDMPTRESNLPEWIEDKLAADEGERAAPAAIPVTSLQATVTEEMDQNTREVIERRERLDAEQAAIDDLETSSIEEFVDDGVERTTPPE
jgi:hypothetical protein